MNAVPLLSQKILYLESLEDRIMYLEDKNALLEGIVLNLKSQFESFAQNRTEDHNQQQHQDQNQDIGVSGTLNTNGNGYQPPADDNYNDVEEPNPMEIMDILNDSGSDRDYRELVIAELGTPTTPTPTPSVITNYDAYTPMSVISEVYSTYSTYSRYSNASSMISQSGRPMRVCPVCGRPVSNIHNHMLTHSAERPFKCTLCEAAFKRADNLKNHILRIHLQIRRQRQNHISTITNGASTSSNLNLDNMRINAIANNNIVDTPTTSVLTTHNYNY